MDSEIRYINTDLDLIAGFDLAPLAAALTDRGVFPLHVGQDGEGRWRATFETVQCFDDPEASMGATLDAIESIGDDARAMWAACSLREFNIGYDCGGRPRGFDNGLSNRTLARAAAAGASLRITLYPPADAPHD